MRAGRSLTDALDALDGELRPGVLALASDVMRRLGTALAVRERLAPRAPPPPVDALLLSALALLLPRGGAAPYADHTLVDQAVTAARHRMPAAAGFVNAVLRRFVRERAALLEAVLHQDVAAFNHPLWWIERVRHDWPGSWRELLEADNQAPPMVLRVNARRSTPHDYVQRLAANGRQAQVVGPQAVWLATPCPVAQLPGFADGDVSVQDLSAQRAAPLLLAPPLPPGARVLDACAAPGGKTAHLLELADLERHGTRRRRRPAAARAADSAAPASAGDARVRRRARARSLVGWHAVSRRAARRAVQRLGRGAAPSRRALAAPRAGPGDPGAHASGAARCVVADSRARRCVAVRDLLDLSCRRAAADRRFFATPRRAGRAAGQHRPRARAAAAGQWSGSIRPCARRG